MRGMPCYLYANKTSDICTPVGQITDKNNPIPGTQLALKHSVNCRFIPDWQVQAGLDNYSQRTNGNYET